MTEAPEESSAPPNSWRAFADRHLNVYIIERETLAWALSKHAHELKGRVLDAGCGRRPYHGLLVNASEVHGFDWNPAGGADVAGSLLALPYRDGSFDAALSTQVMEHVPDPVGMARELHRVLRPGGRLLITVPMVWGEHEIPHDFYRYTSFGLRHVLETAGFRILDLGRRGGVFRMAGQRVAGHLYYTLGRDRLRRISILPVVVGVQHLARALDEAFGRKGDTLGYFALAERS